MQQQPPGEQIPTVNYLLACNMDCSHCFASKLAPKALGPEDSAGLVRMLARAGFKKINFAGGEPMLCPYLDTLIRIAGEAGMFTSMVTNGTRLSGEWLKGMSESLDMVAVSVDSASPDTHRMIGRTENGSPMSAERYVELGRLVRGCGMRLKVNTIVGLHNHTENMTGLIEEMCPERWKIMQVRTIRGQNEHSAGTFEITGEQFEAFVARNNAARNVTVVPESNRAMTGSYVMVDPRERFFDSTGGVHAYGRPILEVGVKEALEDVTVYPERFREWSGLYE